MIFNDRLNIALRHSDPIFSILESIIAIYDQCVITEESQECEWCYKVWRKYKPWFRSVGVHGDPIAIDRGAVGFAYIFQDRVIKFTYSKHEMDVAEILMQKKANLPNLAKVYGCKAVGEWEGRDRYVIVQERIKRPVSKKHRIAGALVYDYLDETTPYHGIGGLENFKKKTSEQITKEIVGIAKPKDESVPALILELVRAIKHIYENTGVLMYDPHGRNLGFKNRRIALFDLGRSEISQQA